MGEVYSSLYSAGERSYPFLSTVLVLYSGAAQLTNNTTLGLVKKQKRNDPNKFDYIIVDKWGQRKCCPAISPNDLRNSPRNSHGAVAVILRIYLINR